MHTIYRSSIAPPASPPSSHFAPALPRPALPRPVPTCPLPSFLLPPDTAWRDGWQINEKRLSKYETEYLQAKEAEAMARDPVAVLKAQNEALLTERMRLEAETENLAREMVLQKVRQSDSILPCLGLPCTATPRHAIL